MIGPRSLTDADKTQVVEWLKNDPEHQTADSTLFTDEAPGRTQFAIEKDGEALFFCSVENVARIHIQFNPQGSLLKNVKGLLIGFKWLMGMLKERGYHELIFDSRFGPLIRMCEKALGFQKRDQDYSVRF